MQTETVKTSTIKPNPNNPRIIRDEKFRALVKSLQEFPQMLELRPIVVDADGVVLGGNMRLRALQEIGVKEVPIVRADSLTPEQQREFIIKDNVGFGEWNWDALANEWDSDELTDWGLDIPGMDVLPMPDELTAEDRAKPPTMKITFPTPEDLQKCESEIQEVINRLCPKAYYSVSAGEL